MIIESIIELIFNGMLEEGFCQMLNFFISATKKLKWTNQNGLD